jgi:hypothetical protein
MLVAHRRSERSEKFGNCALNWYIRNALRKRSNVSFFITITELSMRAVRMFAVTLLLGAFTSALACGPDGKCVGKEKAACCLSKASAKKSCSIKHESKQAKLETSEKSSDPAHATASPAKADLETAQPSETPKR